MRGEPELKPLKDKQGSLKSPYWYIQYYDGNRSRCVSTGYRIGTQDHEAQLALSSFILEREKPTAREPDKLMIAQALKDYWEEHGQYTASAETTNRNIETLKKKFLGEFVDCLTPSRIKKYIRDRNTTNAAANRELAILTAALNHEYNENRLSHVPKIRKLPAHKPRKHFLSDQEIDRLIDNCVSEHIRAFIMIARHTGARPGNIEGLKWFQVDFQNRMIYFTRDGKKESKKRKVDAHMNPSLYDYLKKLYKEKQTEYVLEYTPTWSDKAIPSGCTKKAFGRACERAELPNASRYTLRHSVGTKLGDKGLSMKDVGNALGNTAEMAEKHYVKSIEKRRKRSYMLLDKSAEKVQKSKNRGSRK